MSIISIVQKDGHFSLGFQLYSSNEKENMNSNNG